MRLAFIIAVLVAGCASPTIVHDDITPLEPAKLPAYKWDYPRDQTYLKIRHTDECIKLAKIYGVPMNSIYLATSKYNQFPPHCTEFVIDHNSNLFLGLDRKNFDKFREAMKILDDRNKSYEQLIRNHNEAIRAKSKSLE